MTSSLFGSNSTIADYLVPDIHSDWVGIASVNENDGFTVQTLRRNFSVGDDYKAAVLTGGGTFAGGTLGGNPVAATVGLVGGGIGAFSINKYHFLAGRRSWIIQPAADFGDRNLENASEIPRDALVLETSAIERMSSVVFQTADAVKIIGDLDKAIRRVWIKLLNNFVNKMSLQPLPIRVWGHTTDNVSYVEESHSSRTSCEGSSEFVDIKSRFANIYPPNILG